MNCPFHILMYKTHSRSYRDLPLRCAELGTVYRFERSGVLHGLMRVRGFTQDDAHIFCRPDQVEDEILEVLRFSLAIWKALGFEEVKAYLATRPREGAVGEPARWDQATAALKRAIEHEGLSFAMDEGGGAFYGPKIDLKVKDALGREWQMTTIQFDFNMSERFDMTFVGPDNRPPGPTWCTGRCSVRSSGSSACSWSISAALSPRGWPPCRRSPFPWRRRSSATAKRSCGRWPSAACAPTSTGATSA